MFRRVLFALLLTSYSLQTLAQEANWDQWRGPNFNGSATTGQPPIEWGVNKNIKWKVAIPGAGSSSPIVHDNQVIVLTAVKTDRVKEGATPTAAPPADPPPSNRPGGRRGGGGFGRGGTPVTNYYQFLVVSFDRASGKELWSTQVAEEVPHEAGHNTNTFASSSAVTDGQQIYASFGSRGVHCLDMSGKILWQKQFGQMRTAAGFGEGATPALAGEKLIVPWDHEGESFIIALNTKDGSEIWKTPRSEGTCWATPLVVEFDGRTQVIANGRSVRSYDAESGKLVWECGGQTSNPIPTPIRFGDNVICMTGFRGNSILSIPLSSKGDVTDQVTWSRTDSAPYVPSATLYDGKLYLNKSNNGIVSCLDAATGEPVFAQQRLDDVQMLYSSPVAANGYVYFTGRDGNTVVIKQGPNLDIVATNELGETVDSSLAIVGDTIFVRGQQHLFCIE